MKKLLLGTLLSLSLATAGLVNGIAMTVNDTVITLQDIDNTMQTNNISKDEAVSILLDKVLYESELKKHNINVNIFDVENQINEIAQQNNMNILEFKAAVRQQQNYEDFKKQIKKQLLHQKLIVAIAKGKLTIASKEDISIYYEAHKDQYSIANTIDVIVYMSKDKRALQEQKRNPMQQNANIATQTISLEQDKLSPQVKYIINNTKKNEFSSIFVQDKQYNMFFIQDKKDIKNLNLDDVKNSIFQTIMKTRENSYLKEYFETLKLTAEIKVLR